MIHTEGVGGSDGLCLFRHFFHGQVIRTERDRKQVLHRSLQIRTIRFSQEHAPVCPKLQRQRQKEHLQDISEAMWI